LVALRIIGLPPIVIIEIIIVVIIIRASDARAPIRRLRDNRDMIEGRDNRTPAPRAIPRALNAVADTQAASGTIADPGDKPVDRGIACQCPGNYPPPCVLGELLIQDSDESR
jgi:hypothetical protein